MEVVVKWRRWFGGVEGGQDRYTEQQDECI